MAPFRKQYDCHQYTIYVNGTFHKYFRFTYNLKIQVDHCHSKHLPQQHGLLWKYFLVDTERARHLVVICFVQTNNITFSIESHNTHHWGENSASYKSKKELQHIITGSKNLTVSYFFQLFHLPLSKNHTVFFLERLNSKRHSRHCISYFSYFTLLNCRFGDAFFISYRKQPSWLDENTITLDLTLLEG